MKDDLIHRIREGPANGAQWAKWYRSVYPKLYYFAFRLASGNSDSAKDLVQESFARFIEYGAIERIHDEHHALSFLFKTCRNLAFDDFAVSRRFVGLEPDQFISEKFGTAVDQEIDVARMLSSLSEEDRGIMNWVLSGESIAEVARRLDTSYTAAGVRIHRIRSRLRTENSE